MKLIELVLLWMVVVYEATSLEILANYRFWNSISEEMAYDYTGNQRHLKLYQNYIVTDRGISPNPLFYIEYLSYNSILTSEYTVSFWLLNKADHSRHNTKLYHTSGNFRFTYYVVGQLVSAYDGYRAHTAVGANSVVNWNLHTIVMKKDATTHRMYYDFYKNFRSKDSIYLDITANYIYYTKWLQEFGLPNAYTDMILYEMWVHVGMVSINDIRYLISDSSSCLCGYDCPTTPSTICLPTHTKLMNYDGKPCNDCMTNNESCDRDLNCIAKSKAGCKYGLYDVKTLECMFYCPMNSCVSSSTVDPITYLRSFDFTCEVGYNQLSNNPLACMSIHCLNYHKLFYQYVCEVTETGYDLDSLGDCCVCSSGYTQVSSFPLVCMNIPNCIEYIQIEGKYVCSNCAMGFTLDPEGRCIECKLYPFACAFKNDHCAQYLQVKDDWRCQICEEGYKIGSAGLCDECEAGFLNVDPESFICKLKVPNCLDYDLTSELSKCITCDTGYQVDSNNQCNQCESGFIQISDSPICVREISNCIDYYNDGIEWVCNKCAVGYDLTTVCIEKIEHCLNYTSVEDQFLCVECKEGFYISNDKLCKACSDNCISCNLEDENIECLECSSGYVFKDKHCSLDETNAPVEFDNLLIDNTALIVQVAFAISACVSVVTLNIDNFFSAMGTNEILSFILLYNLEVPSKVKDILEGISLFTIFPNLFEYLIPNEKTLSIDRYNRVDYKNELLLINSGKLFTVLILIIALTLILKILNHFTHKLEDASIMKKSIKKFLEILEWNFLLGYLIQGSLQLSITSLINIVYVSFFDVHSIIGFSISLVVLLLILVSPIKLLLFYLKTYESIKSNSLSTKYTILYENMKTETSYLILLNIIIMIRRVIYGVNMVLFYHSPYIQVLINSCFSFTISHFILIFKPYKTKLDNYKNLYIETNTFLILSIIGAFIYEDLSSKLYDVSEWSLVILIYMSIMVPALINIVILIKDVIHKCRSRTQVIANTIEATAKS